jgi:hypothetical protein
VPDGAARCRRYPVALATLIVLRSSADLSASATDYFGPDQQATSSVNLPANGSLSGQTRLENRSRSGFCVVAVIAFVDSLDAIIGARQTAAKCVNGVQTGGAPVTRIVPIKMTITEANLLEATNLRIRATTDTSSALSVLLPRLFP